jgi:hypothetical protein
MVDTAKSVDLFTKAAVQGNADAQLNGLTANLHRFVFWMRHLTGAKA